MAAVLEVLVCPAGSVHRHTGQQLKQKAGEIACSDSKPQYPAGHMALSWGTSCGTQQPCRRCGCHAHYAQDAVLQHASSTCIFNISQKAGELSCQAGPASLPCVCFIASFLEHGHSLVGAKADASLNAWIGAGRQLPHHNTCRS